MTIRKLTCLCAVLLGASACGGRSGGSPVDNSVDPSTTTPTTETPTTTPSDTLPPADTVVPPGWNFGGNECGLVEAPEGSFPLRIRLLGVTNPGYTQVQLDAHLVVTVDDDSTPVLESDLAVNLADGNSAWLLGQGFIPDGAGVVHVKIAFDDFGAFDTGAIDASGMPIEFSAPAEVLRGACHAVVSLFLGCSLVERGDDLVLLPQLVVRYW